MAHHYVYGSGMSGCLYDNGPHTAKTLDEAIESLIETFSDLDNDDLLAMRNDLRESGIHYFKGEARELAGADYCDATQEESDPKIAALAEHLDVPYGSISEKRGDTYDCDEARGEWLVLTDDEREQAASNSLDSYIDECGLLDGVSDVVRDYFDRARWKEDALRSDGYGHTIGAYDGEEHEQQIDGVVYYIYRVN